jgi:hypothetical protein
MLQAALLDRLTRALGKNPDQATPRDISMRCRSPCARS